MAVLESIFDSETNRKYRTINYIENGNGQSCVQREQEGQPLISWQPYLIESSGSSYRVWDTMVETHQNEQTTNQMKPHHE